MSVRLGVGWLLTLTFAVLLCEPAAVQAQEQPWKFVVFGDSRGSDPIQPVNTNVLAELAREVVAQGADFLLYMGDFSLSGGSEAIAMWAESMAPVFRAEIPIYPVIGNHDYTSIEAISNLFRGSLPSNGPAGDESGTYAMFHKNSLIVVLNQFAPTNEYRVNQDWLDAVLATNTRPHVFAAGHLPAFKLLHYDCLDDFPLNRDSFWNSLSNANVRIYFAAHDHFYDHSRMDDGDGIPANDLHQMIVGTGGAPPYPDGLYDGNNGIWNPSRVRHESGHGYLTAEVSGDHVTTSWYQRIDTNSFVRTLDVLSYSAYLPPVLRHKQTVGGLALSWSGPGTLQVAHDITGAFTNVPAATSPFIVSNLAGAQAFYRLVLP